MPEEPLPDRSIGWYRPFFYLALAGFFTSLAVHLSTYAGYYPFQENFWFLHIGIFAVFIPAFLGNRRGNPPGSRSNRVHTDHYPQWLKRFCDIVFAYTLLNFTLSMYLSHGGAPNIQDGKYVLSNHGMIIRDLTEAQYYYYKSLLIRAFSGHWLLFYGWSAAILGMLPKLKKPDPLESAPGGAKWTPIKTVPVLLTERFIKSPVKSLAVMWVIVGAIIYVFTLGPNAYNQALKTANWPSVPGVIIQSGTKPYYSGNGRGASPDVKYQYTVGGRAYIGDRIDAKNHNGPEGYVQDYVRRFPLHAAVTVFYDPADPGKPLLFAGPTPEEKDIHKYVGPFVLIFFLTAALLITFDILRMMWRRKQQSNFGVFPDR
jgi:hypothetical protein